MTRGLETALRLARSQVDAAATRHAGTSFTARADAAAAASARDRIAVEFDRHAAAATMTMPGGLGPWLSRARSEERRLAEAAQRSAVRADRTRQDLARHLAKRVALQQVIAARAHEARRRLLRREQAALDDWAAPEAP